MKQKPNFSEYDTKVISIQLLLAADFMHLNRYLHRDLKPDNILMRENNNSLLYDLVFADLGLSIREDKIKASLPCGTPGYVAPEVLLRGTQSYKNDIFSIGCILYKLISGKYLFAGLDA
jgi:calcium/calmodulin-dependent protein kinase I